MALTALPISTLLLLAAACGDTPPPNTPNATNKPDAKPVAAVVDLSPVEEPKNLLVIGRVQKPEAVLKVVGGWASFPLPGASELVKSVSDASVAEAVDLSQPVDGAVMLGGAKMSPEPIAAFSVAVKSVDDAKAKLSAKHRLTPAPNGAFIVEGVGKPSFNEPKGAKEDKGPDDDDEGTSCTLAPATTGGRLVCGDRKAVEQLLPYLTRTMPKLSFTSDVHVELRFAPLREPVQGLKALLPFLIGGGSKTPPAVRTLAEASAGELADAVNDMNRLVMDTQLADLGATSTVKVEFQSTNSTIAKIATSNADKADAPPAAFYKLPAETDLAYYARGSDPKLFDRPRELVGNAMMELSESSTMPEAERKALRDLVIDRTATLFTGAVVYGKGFDGAALDKAIANVKAVKAGDDAADSEARKAVAEQVIGWHLVQVNQPVSQVGAVLKDYANIWARPGFKKWVKDNASSKMQAQLRIAPTPAGLPKDTVHLEITIPREDLTVWPPASMATPAPPKPGGPAVKPGPEPKPKKIPQKPVVLHLIAAPDGGATWVGFSADAKLLAARAAIAIAGGDKDTLAKSPTAEALRDSKANAAGLFTVRGLVVFAALSTRRSHSAYGGLAGLPHKGTSPITITVASQGPAAGAPGGVSTSTFKLPRAAIEDIVRLALDQQR